VTAPSPALAVEGYAYVQEQVADSLSRLQDANNVGAANQTGLHAIVEPTVPYVTPASVVRPAAGVVLLGVGSAIALATLADAFAKRRSVGSRASVSRPADGVAAGPDDDTDVSAASSTDVLHSIEDPHSDTSQLVGGRGRRS
jgi:hypothetical protein